MKRLTRRCKQALNDKMTRFKKFIEIALSEPKYHEKGNFSTQSTYDIYETNRLYPMADKLASYEDAEEQGLLLRLPCKVGDIVYLIKSNGEITEREANIMFLGVLWDEFNKEWFLTREEAEKALADMGV